MGRKNYQTSTSPREFPRQHKELPPFPKSQMLVLALCRICEPIAFMSIFPYIYYMIEDFRITTDESKIAVYAGMVTSAFTFAEFSTGVIWGKLSDKIGRKPVLLMGLAGTGISVLSFGFAPNLPVALIARAIGGLLNGNIGVLQTTVAELVTVKEHQPRAYTIMPLVWCLGSIIGPMIGGALARPCISYPTMFAKGTIWEKFPYLLPNLFSACAVFCGVIIGILFLEETHTEKRNRRDPGLELGRRLSSWFKSRAVQQIKKKDETRWLLETDSLDLEEDELPGYCSSQSSPHLRSVTPTLNNKPEIIDPLRLADEETAFAEKTPGAPVKIFTKTVILHIVSYGILAFHTMTFDQLFPVFLSTEHRAGQGEFKLPFKFADGFGMETKEIGVVLAVQGLYSMFSTSVLFPMIVRRVGALALFRFLAITYFMLYLATPYLVLLPTNLRMLGIYLVVIWKCTFSTLIYPSNAILIANSAPSTMTLGTINGVAASTASLCRAFGPTISGALYALGLSKGYSGLAWWCSGAVTLIGAAISTRISELPGRLDIDEAECNAENEATLVGFEDGTHDFPSESAGARYS